MPLSAIVTCTQGSFVQVTIADNGIGFDAADIEAGYENRGSLGMINMRERAELIDASLKIESLAGKGTIVTLLVPMRVAEAHHASVPAGTTTTRLAAAATQRASRTAGR
jgi:nitrate/nitrite-specific signal transduction histidine kinase